MKINYRDVVVSEDRMEPMGHPELPAPADNTREKRRSESASRAQLDRLDRLDLRELLDNPEPTGMMEDPDTPAATDGLVHGEIGETKERLEPQEKTDIPDSPEETERGSCKLSSVK